jgi:hypothetical protein
MKYQVNDIIRMPHFETMPKGTFRFWKVMAYHLGSTVQESVVRLMPIDCADSTEGDCLVPLIMIETHPAIEVC